MRSMMTDAYVSSDDNTANISPLIKGEELSAEDLHQIEIGARTILRAQEIQAHRDQELHLLAEAEKRSQVGVYNDRRSLLMPMTDYVKLLGFIIFAVVLYFFLHAFLKLVYANKPQLLVSYEGQLTFVVVAFLIMLTWLVARIYYFWALDYVYADVNHVRRTRRPIWYLGIRKISFEVPTKTARCNNEPTNFEIAICKIGFDASSIDIDTNIDRDEPLHDLKFIKDADRLESIINSVS